MDMETLQKMKDTDIRVVDINDLVDIRDVVIDTSLSKEERVLDYIRNVKNPYCYRVGKIIVKESYADTDVTFEDRFLQYIKSL